MQLEDFPNELLHLVVRRANPRDACALMRTSRKLYEKLAPELYQDLPVLRLSELTYGYMELQEKSRLQAQLQVAAQRYTGARLTAVARHLESVMCLLLLKAAPMSVGHLEQYGAKTKNLILHLQQLPSDPHSEEVLRDALRDVFHLLKDSSQLEVFGFTTSSRLSHDDYDAFVKILESNIRPRILLLPHENLERGSDPLTQMAFSAQFHVRRGGELVEEDPDTVCRRVRERPNVTLNHRKFLDVYAPECTDLKITRAAIEQSLNTVEEVTIFGSRYVSEGGSQPLMTIPREMEQVCGSIGLDFESLRGLHLHHCMLGPISPFSRIKVSDKLRSITIVNSFIQPDLVNDLSGGYPGEMKPCSTGILLGRIQDAHAGKPGPKPNRFIYRQYTKHGNEEDRLDPLTDAQLQKFISISTEWKVLCFHRDIPFEGSIMSFAFKTLVYASFRFGIHEQPLDELTVFGELAPSLQWLGVNYNEFTQIIEHLDRNYDKGGLAHLGHAIRSMKKLRVLCLFASTPRTPYIEKCGPILETAVKVVANAAVRAGVPLEFIHLVFRSIDCKELWAARSYRVRCKNRIRRIRKTTARSSHHVALCFTRTVILSRVTQLSHQEHDDLEAMGGGNRFTMHQTLTDTLGHLHVSKKEMEGRLLKRICRVDKEEQARMVKERKQHTQERISNLLKKNRMEMHADAELLFEELMMDNAGSGYEYESSVSDEGDSAASDHERAVPGGTKRALSPAPSEDEPEPKLPRLADGADT